MSNFIGRPPFSNSLWVGIETMQFHIAQTKIFLRTPSFPIQGVPINNLTPMKNCPGGMQGNLNWMPGYRRCSGSGVILIVSISDICGLPYLFYSHEYRLTRNTVYCAILSDQIVVGCPLGVPISYYNSIVIIIYLRKNCGVIQA